MKQNRIDQKFGGVSWRIYVFLALFLGASGILYYNTYVKGIEGLFWGTVLILVVAALVLFSIPGIEVDPEKRQYKNYLQVFFLKIGVWKSYDSYTDILLLRYKESNARPMDSGKELPGSGRVIYETYLARPNHFDMILLRQTRSKVEGEKAANELAHYLGLPWVQYNPGGRRTRQILGGKRPMK